ncbi:MAG: hypothetical protein RLZZ435_3262 [Cyanobacteriota bacterium]|jgi:hypothetical protein
MDPGVNFCNKRLGVSFCRYILFLGTRFFILQSDRLPLFPLGIQPFNVEERNQLVIPN